MPLRICSSCGFRCLESHRFCPSCGSDLSGAALRQTDDRLQGMNLAGKYLLRDLLGSGGMGDVYNAEQVGVGRTVAVKVMHRHLLGDETAVARFNNEARASSRLNHPNSVCVLDFGQTESGILYLVMELLRGSSLDRVLEDEFPFSLGRVVAIVCQALDAIEAAHGLGIVHRDLKPENVFLERSGGQDFVKVIDFGVAKMLDVRDLRITTPGLVPGTPEYMSPEQARGDSIDHLTDVYAMGVLLYEMLTGSVPFKGSSALETMMAHVQEAPLPPSRRRPESRLPPPLEALVLRALQKGPSERLASAGLFRDLLAACAEVAGYWPCTAEMRAASAALIRRHLPEAVFGPLEVAAAGRREEEGLEKAPELLSTVSGLKTRVRGEVGGDGAVVLDNETLGRLRSFLEEGIGGRVLRLQAPAGSGKSRLVRIAIQQARDLGLTVIHCQPDPGWIAGPLSAARRVASSCLLAAGASPPEDLPRVAARLGLDEELVGLTDIFSFSSPRREQTPASRRRERSVAFRHLLHRTAAERKLLVVFEEMDRYDEPSRELVASLVASPGGHHLRLLLTSSEAGSAQLWPPNVELLELPRPGVETMASIVRAHFDPELPPEMADRLAIAAQGSPLRLIQLACADLFEGIAEPPERLADLLAARIERAPQPEREVLQWMAVVNDRVTVELLAQVSGRKIGIGLLRRLADKGFLVERGGGTFSFAHHLLALVAHSSLPAEVRRGLHRRMAEYLRAAGGVPAALLAHHSFEAAEGPAAVAELELAGHEAAQCLDLAGAVRWYIRALETVRREWGTGHMEPAELDRIAVDLARRLAGVLRQQGEMQAARGILEETLSVAAGGGESRAALRLELGRIDLELAHLERAARHLALACADADAAGDLSLLAATNLELAQAVGLLGDAQRAAELLQRGLEAAEAAAGGVGKATWESCIDAGVVSSLVGDPDRARGLLLDALQQAEKSCSVLGILRASSQLAELHLAAAEWNEAEVHLVEALRCSELAGDRTLRVRLLTDLGRSRRRQGERNGAEELLRQALQLAASIGWWEGIKAAERELELLELTAARAR